MLVVLADVQTCKYCCYVKRKHFNVLKPKRYHQTLPPNATTKLKSQTQASKASTKRKL